MFNSSSERLSRLSKGEPFMPDKTLTCKDCNETFVFTEGEQKFYVEKGFENDPVRCPACRKSRKTQRNDRPRRNYDR